MPVLAVSMFAPQSFWLVEALTRAGWAFPEKLDKARFMFERVPGCDNHLGLYADRKAKRWATSRRPLHISR